MDMAYAPSQPIQECYSRLAAAYVARGQPDTAAATLDAMRASRNVLREQGVAAGAVEKLEMSSGVVEGTYKSLMSSYALQVRVAASWCICVVWYFCYVAWRGVA